MRNFQIVIRGNTLKYLNIRTVTEINCIILNNTAKKAEAVPLDAMKALGGIGDIAPTRS
jgi:hypothetical protein